MSDVAVTGGPVLVVPFLPRRPFVRFDTVLLAWRRERRAAAALRAALPFLACARRVHLVTWDDDMAARIADQQRVVDHLRLHGVPAVERHEGYSHGPVRELLLGGATSTVLREMRLPVLMAR
jgi:nucleotide-binding universal stress UspA family protein